MIWLMLWFLFVGGLVVFVAWMAHSIDAVLDRRMHSRLADHAIKLAQTYEPGSAGYKTAITAARAHAHKAGFDNGYTPDEWDKP